jgi:long-chain fatty acid transport protein
MKSRILKAAILSAGLCPAMAAAQLPGLPFSSFTAGGTGLTPFYVMGFELGVWQDYLARELTPEYMTEPDLPALHISWLDPEMVSILPAFAGGLVREPRTFMRYELEVNHLNTLNSPTASLNAPGMGFERQLLAPGVFHALDESSVLGVEAIMAYQSFGTSQLGMQTIGGPSSFGPLTQTPQPYGVQPFGESSYGTGVRLNLSSAIADRFTVGAGFQSRIDMEEFAHYRGVYSNPADFDIPARASLGVAYQANANSSVNVSVERVMYSEVSAFQSRLLPDRFLAQLGDSTSPNFTWDDLTVFKLGYSWTNNKDTQWRAEVSSRSTPAPSSASLERALSSEVADHAMLLGFSRRTGALSRFNVNAAYAPADYLFGGNVLGVASEDLGQDLEVEAVWTVDF